jgi:hypothetical protein
VELTLNDAKTFSKFLHEHKQDLPNSDLSGITDAGIKKLAVEDMNQVRKTFTSDQLVAGMEILNSLVDSFHLGDSDKQLYFARNAYIGWILGYVIEKGAVAK